jgi:rhomboid protease GluP
LPAFTTGELQTQCVDCRARAIMAQMAAPRRVVVPKAWLTYSLVGLNVLIFAGMVLRGMSPMMPANSGLLQWGANYGPLSLGAQPWRILTSNYLHGGIVHLLLNMWCLWNLGQLAEFVFGRWTTLLVYTACGLAGSVASLGWHPLVVGVGASGAIFGLAGALIAAIYLGKLPYAKEGFKRTFKSLLSFAFYNLLFGAAIRGVDNAAHIGGLVMGLVLGAVLGQVLIHPPDERKSLDTLVFGGALLVLLGAFTLVKHQQGYVVPLGRAVEQLQQGQTEAAVSTLKDGTQAYPKSYQLQEALAEVYAEKGMQAEAEAAQQRAQELQPK